MDDEKKFSFKNLKKPEAGERPKHPKDIFAQRPSSKGTMKEMWQSQATALDEWWKVKDRHSLISMYTGAGKTLVGVLIAQSYINQGVQNVLYLCPTIDLIKQTYKEAAKAGIKATTYYAGKFSDENFARGKTFCITTYQSAINTRSKFRGASSPGAIVFDDAHVGEHLMRDAFTLAVSKSKRPELFASLASCLRPGFEKLNIASNFDQALGEHSAGAVILCPPTEVIDAAEKIQDVLVKHMDNNDPDYYLPFDYIKGKIGFCCITISKDKIEISPPFVPSLFTRILEDNSAPKVYLSATVRSKADIVRAFGRSPILIEPEVDSGKGERTFLFGSDLKSTVADNDYLRSLIQRHKVLISVPSDRVAAKVHVALGTNRPDVDFSEALDRFRNASSGAFVLVGRYDGIDLPDEQCNVLSVEGLPVGTSQIEKYLFESLRLDRSYFSTINNRLTQLFGRINRGKNDFGIYFIRDKKVENWIRNERNKAGLPRILQEQINFSEALNEQIADCDGKTLDQIVDQIVNREEDWLDHYGAHMRPKALDDAKIAEQSKEFHIEDDFAKRESRFIVKLWQGDIEGAIEEFNVDFSPLSQINPRQLGWYSIWLGIAHLHNGDIASAHDWFDEARRKLGGRIPLPRRSRMSQLELEKEKTVIEEGLRQFLLLDKPQLIKAISKLQDRVAPAFDPSAEHRPAEEAVREIGAAMGFDSRRPCTDDGTGPDNVWIDHHSKSVIPFELKTDKMRASSLSKEDIGQSHNHIQWIKDNYPKYKMEGLLIYTECEKVSPKSNPSPDMYFSNSNALREIWRQYISIVTNLSNDEPLIRFVNASKIGEKEEWASGDIFRRLSVSQLNE
ncbi:DEAD/DEAH box helicase family protein [Agrobacterium rosae]|uniref:DEAD/DEAH box helicase family protein n=1 Tax=Agrobacterium rosae TaxID=1972867 RepID=A0ABU4VZ79_9HYPH|nr:DEAD/DEAH box helicase family protein [Agrobacterium rosae]MCM2433417.1 DEAD/DEAH box helicase family protein [Agrobacterium rosae]MDX8330031.1 DEAD/DEAH box helicase family protein [Agrobacterium rosae]